MTEISERHTAMSRELRLREPLLLHLENCVEALVKASNGNFHSTRLACNVARFYTEQARIQFERRFLS